MSHVTEISEQLFEKEVLKSSIPVLVDFFAPWCGPCRALAPTLEELALDTDYVNKVKIVKINVDDNENIAKQYNVRSIPTLILFKNSEKLTTISGAQSKSELTKLLKEHV